MFKHINNNKPNDMFLIHGWATDYKIFDNLNLDYNYILINNQNPREIINGIYFYCKQNNLQTINILGWSMGSFIAIDFIKKYGTKIQVKDLILISVCKQYDKKGIQNIRKFLAKNKALYLYNFYKKCFSNNSDFEEFHTEYFEYYLNKLTTEDLNIGLDYLEQASLDIEFLNKLTGQTKITITNAEDDLIIDTVETRQCLVSTTMNKNINVKFLKDCGHLLFWDKQKILF